MGKIRLLLVLVIVGIALVAKADIAPEPRVGETAISMKAEKVTITLLGFFAKVEAEFIMDASSLAPLQYCRPLPEGGTECGDKYYQFVGSWPLLKSQEGRIEDFKIKVGDGDASPFRDGQMPLSQDKLEKMKFDLSDVTWARFASPRIKSKDALDDLRIVVTYKEKLELKDGAFSFTYVLRSGALWAGTIGQAEIILNLVPGYKIENPTFQPNETKANSLHWQFKDFEPDKDLSFEIRKE